jgi:hypothetical protein
MMFNKQKRNKKKVIDRLRKYARGEDLVTDLFGYDPRVLENLSTQQLKQLIIAQNAKERGIEPVTGFLITDAETGEVKEMIPVNNKPVWFEDAKLPSGERPSWYRPTIDGVKVSDTDFDRMVNDESINKLVETRSYKDPEIEGVSYSSPDAVVDDFKAIPKPEETANVSDSDNCKMPAIKRELSRQELHKQYLEAKLKEIERQMENDLRLRARMGRSQH